MTQFNSGVFGLCYSSSPVTAEDINGGGGGAAAAGAPGSEHTAPLSRVAGCGVYGAGESSGLCVCVCLHTCVLTSTRPRTHVL